MARPRKTGLSYFPMDCVWDEKARAFESVFKNDGFVWLVKFWQTAYQDENGSVDFDGIYGVIHPNNCRITPQEHLGMLTFAVSTGLIFKNSQGTYTSNGIQKRMGMVRKDRERERNRSKNVLSGQKPPSNPPIRGETETETKTETKEKSKSVPAAPPSPTVPRFIKPPIPEIMAYCEERDNRVDPQKFYDHYESNGWKVGRNPMKDWRAAVRTWERSGYETGLPGDGAGVVEQAEKIRQKYGVMK